MPHQYNGTVGMVTHSQAFGDITNCATIHVPDVALLGMACLLCTVYRVCLLCLVMIMSLQYIS